MSVQDLLKQKNFEKLADKCKSDKKVRKEIISLATENNSLKNEAITTLGFIGDKESFKHLFSLILADSSEQELEAAREAVEQAAIPAVEYFFEKALSSKSNEQQKVFNFLGKLKKKLLEETLADINIVDPFNAYLYEIMTAVYLGRPEKSVYQKKFDYSARETFSKEIRSVVTKALSESEDEAIHDNMLHLIEQDPLIREASVPEILKVLKTDERVSLHLPLIRLFDEKMKSNGVEEFLIRGLTSSDREYRKEVIKAIGRTKSSNAISKLIDILKEDDKDITYEAAVSLGNIGEPAAQTLIDNLKKFTDLENLHLALKTIGEPAVNHLAEAMGSKDKKIRENASRICIIILSQKYGYSGTITKLIELLTDKSEDVQSAVIESIIDMGEPAIPHVISYVPQSTKAKARDNALDIIEHFGETMVKLTLERQKANEAAVLGAILYIFLDEASGEEVSHVIQKIALDTLYAVKSKIDEARPDVARRICKNATKEALTPGMLEKEEFIRKNAAWLARLFLEEAAKMLEEFMKKEKSQDVKRIAIESIGEMGRGAKNMGDFLVSLLSDKQLCIPAVRSLGKIGDTDAIKEISKSIQKSKSEEFKEEAMKVIGLLEKLE